jgi:hypothetical protein
MSDVVIVVVQMMIEAVVNAIVVVFRALKCASLWCVFGSRLFSLLCPFVTVNGMSPLFHYRRVPERPPDRRTYVDHIYVAPR